MFRAEAKRCRMPSRPTAFAKTRPRNSPPRSVIRYFGAPKVLAVAARSRAILAASGFASQTLQREGHAGEGVEDAGHVEDLEAEERAHLGDVHHPDVVDEARDHRARGLGGARAARETAEASSR